MNDFVEWLKKQESVLAAMECDLAAIKRIEDRKDKLTDCFLQRERIATALNLYDEYRKTAG